MSTIAYLLLVSHKTFGFSPAIVNRKKNVALSTFHLITGSDFVTVYGNRSCIELHAPCVV